MKEEENRIFSGGNKYFGRKEGGKILPSQTGRKYREGGKNNISSAKKKRNGT